MGTTTALGFESKLWATADALRNNMDVAEYKHVAPGLIFLKYISDAFEDDGEPFEEKMARLAATLRTQQAEAARLDAAIAVNLKELGYGE